MKTKVHILITLITVCILSLSSTPSIQAQNVFMSVNVDDQGPNLYEGYYHIYWTLVRLPFTIVPTTPSYNNTQPYPNTNLACYFYASIPDDYFQWIVYVTVEHWVQGRKVAEGSDQSSIMDSGELTDPGGFVVYVMIED
jgi:hypothetical protein